MTIGWLARFLLWLSRVFCITKRADDAPESAPRAPTSHEPKVAPTPSVPADELKPPGTVKDEVPSPPPSPRKPHVKKTPIQESRRETRKKISRTTEPQTRKESTTKDLTQLPSVRTKPHTTGVKVLRTKSDRTGSRSHTECRIRSPYVELDVREPAVYLVVPEQRFNLDASQAHGGIRYRVVLNDDEQEAEAKTKMAKGSENTVVAREVRIKLEKPLHSFRIRYPQELEFCEYTWKKPDGQSFYAFEAIGGDRGRWHRFDPQTGILGALPKRMMWFLVHEDFDLQSEPAPLVEEAWVWEKFKPWRVDLKHAPKLVLVNTRTGNGTELPCRENFKLEGNAVPDDYRDEQPLMTGEHLCVKAPYMNKSGWLVWIQSRFSGARLVKKEWDGGKPIRLGLPEDLPCECGEFQVDICRDDGRPDAVLFFRWLPSVKLDYPKDLRIPDSRHGHSSAQVSFSIPGDSWVVRHNSQRIEKGDGNSYSINLDSTQDRVRFTVTRDRAPETETVIQATVPRLRWRVGDDSEWKSQTVSITKDSLVYGKPLVLHVAPCDWRRQYYYEAVLQRKNGDEIQERMLECKSGWHNLGLNSFYDTILTEAAESILKLRVSDVNGNPIGDAVVARFLPEVHQERPSQPMKPLKGHTAAQPVVIGGHGRKRKGKGYSAREIFAAGFDLATACQNGMPFDKRRNSCHDWNCSSLAAAKKGVERAD